MSKPIDTRSCEYCGYDGCACLSERYTQYLKEKREDRKKQNDKADKKQRYSTTRHKST